MYTHPIAEAPRDEYFCFAWQLRHEAFLRFGYDPDAVFSEKVDERGFREQGRTGIPGVNLLGSRAQNKPLWFCLSEAEKWKDAVRLKS